MRSAAFLLVFLLFAAALVTGASAAFGLPPITYYVATNGLDSWSGTLPAPNAGHTDGPFASVARAQAVVRTSAGTRIITVQVRQGTYYLTLSPTSPGTLSFGSADSGTATFPIVWQNYPGEVPILSGGERVGSGGFGRTWTHTGTSALWQVTLPSTVVPFESLYYTSAGVTARRLRPRLESANGVGYSMSGTQCMAVNPLGPPTAVATSFCNLGTFLRVAGTIPQSAATCSVANSMSDGAGNTKCLDRFTYNLGDPIANFINLQGTYTGNTASPCTPNLSNPYPAGDVEVTLFNAWTADVMRINCIDTTGRVIYLTGPTKKSGAGNYDDFGPAVGRRYIVENPKDAITAAFAAGQTGLWFLDRSTASSVLYYIANAGENPNNDEVILPQLGGAIPGGTATDYVGGGLLSVAAGPALSLSNVTFQGLTFEVDNFTPAAGGFNNDVNGEMSLPQAIDCEGCQHVTFDTVTVRHTSASGILIASATTGVAARNDAIQNSIFADLGDSGVRIGHTPLSTDTAAGVVNNVTVQNNIVKGYSRIFPDGEGIAEGNGNTISYLYNDILDGYHAGLVVCELSCPGAETGANGTNILSQYNHIRNTMQGITSDIGALYYNIGGENGSGSGNRILNNLVHDTTDASIIDFGPGVALPGYGGHGIYLDAHSGGVDVENNVVYRVSAYTAHMTEGPTVLKPPNPNVFKNNIFALGASGMFILNQPWPPLSSGAASCIPGTTSALQVQFLDNIFDFDLNEPAFNVLGGCTNSCGQDYDQFEDFQGNAYWRAGTGTSGYPLFCNDSKAFHVIDPQPSDGSCPAGSPVTNLTFDTPAMGAKTWQYGAPPSTPVPMHEDVTPLGVCNYDPGFGTTGNPSDYLLSATPPTSFNISLTNDTINNAGRTSGPAVATVPATFPTYVLTTF
jgi:hypothetical protein